MAIRYIILFLLSCFSLGEVFAQSSLAKRDSLPRRRRVVTQSPKDEVSAEPAKRTRSKIVNDSVKNIYGPKTTLSTTDFTFKVGNTTQMSFVLFSQVRTLRSVEPDAA